MKNTLAIIKPDAMKKGCLEDIRKDILDNGFDIVEEKNFASFKRTGLRLL